MLDDYLAFVIAVRLGLSPILLLDALVKLTKEELLTQVTAVNIVQQVSARYSSAFVSHTFEKLRQLKT